MTTPTPEPMRLRDVPDEILDAAWDAWVSTSPEDEEGALRVALAAALPVHEALVRAKVAAEIEAVVVIARRDQPPADAKAEAYRNAAKIARGETR